MGESHSVPRAAPRSPIQTIAHWTGGLKQTCTPAWKVSRGLLGTIFEAMAAVTCVGVRWKSKWSGRTQRWSFLGSLKGCGILLASVPNSFP